MDRLLLDAATSAAAFGTGLARGLRRLHRSSDGAASKGRLQLAVWRCVSKALESGERAAAVSVFVLLLFCCCFLHIQCRFDRYPSSTSMGSILLQPLGTSHRMHNNRFRQKFLNKQHLNPT